MQGGVRDTFAYNNSGIAYQDYVSCPAYMLVICLLTRRPAKLTVAVPSRRLQPGCL